ncbi:MAG: gephyrin-like molybdotransferase Glp [Rhodomicrobiaceae bacterium]
MLSVAQALQQVIGGIEPLSAETVKLDAAHGRILADDLAARLTQPPFPSSAMDGYAVRRTDLQSLPATLSVIGESAAGHPFSGMVRTGEAVRIFTGAVVPDDADYIVIQENVTATDKQIEIREIGAESHIRERGGDFREGDTPLRAGRRLTPRDVLLAAQMNHAELPVRRKPKIAILASGDELVPPGGELAPGQIISSIPAGLGAMLQSAGAAPVLLGIAGDTLEDLGRHIANGHDADVLVTIGGASVGDHDLVRKALEMAGYEIGFHKIAMRPGKPLMSGMRGARRVIGLPGNPVSAMICGLVFLTPLVAALLGEDRPRSREILMPLAASLTENGVRQHYMRAKFAIHEGREAVEPLPSQDSSLTATLAAADCLIVRAPNAPALQAGANVPVIPLFP